MGVGSAASRGAGGVACGVIFKDALDYATAWAEEERLMHEGIGLRIGEIAWTRDELHDR